MALTDSDEHITDTLADTFNDATGGAAEPDTRVPGPSPNPATNLIINDIVLRSIGRLSRHTVQKFVLGKQYSQEFAKAAVENRSVVNTLASYGVTKLATRSVPGAALVGTGLLLKVLFDRSQSRRAARRAGHKQLRKQAEE